MQIVLQTGLVLRHGQRTLEVVRVLDEQRLQLEDCLTRRPLVIDRHAVLKRIWDKTYHVVVSHATALSDEELVTTDIAIDLSSLSESAKREIDRRMSYVKALQKAHVSRGQRLQVTRITSQVAKSLQDERTPSASTVMSWARKYQSSLCNPMALRSANTHRARVIRIPDRIEQLIQLKLRTVYFTKKRLSLRHTLDQIQLEVKRLVEAKEVEASQAKVSLATLSRRVKEVDVYRRISSREGVARARVVCRTVMTGAGASYPLQRVEIDHTPLNWVVICDRTRLPLGRPLLTVAIDAFSNYVLGFYLSFYGPGLTSVCGVMRNALMPKADFVKGVQLAHPWLAHGVGDELVLDNGLEFHSKSFKHMAWELGSDLTYCRVRTPWLKPHVERFFATLDYLTLVRGRIHKPVVNAMNLDPRRDAAIKFSDLVRGLIMYVSDVHPTQINERKLARPLDLFQEGLERCPPAAYPGDMRALRLTSAMSKELTVGPGGIELHGLPYGREELFPLRKRYGERFKTLVKWDPDDMSTLYVQDPQAQTWLASPCRWEDYASALSWNQHKLMRHFARKTLQLNGAYEDLLQAKQRLSEHWLESTSFKTTADAKLAARFSGVTSARVMESPQNLSPRSATTKLLSLNEESKEVSTEIPDFETFEME